MPDNPQRRRRPPSNASSDIERFLAEVDRLRRKSAGDTGRTPDVRPADDVMDVIPVEQPQPQARPRVRPQAPRARKFDEVEVIDYRAAASTPPAVAFAMAPATPAERPAAVALPVAPSAVKSVQGISEAGALTSRAINANAVRMLNLLRSDNMRAAVLLREVLDPPLCKRRR